MDQIARIKGILQVLGSYSGFMNELMIKGLSIGALIDNNYRGGSMGEDPGEQCKGRIISFSWGIFKVYSGNKSETI